MTATIKSIWPQPGTRVLLVTSTPMMAGTVIEVNGLVTTIDLDLGGRRRVWNAELVEIAKEVDQ